MANVASVAMIAGIRPTTTSSPFTSPSTMPIPIATSATSTSGAPL
jgi:hypothetical protein